MHQYACIVLGDSLAVIILTYFTTRAIPENPKGY
jgi:hypothetical protein